MIPFPRLDIYYLILFQIKNHRISRKVDSCDYRQVKVERMIFYFTLLAMGSRGKLMREKGRWEEEIKSWG